MCCTYSRHFGDIFWRGLPNNDFWDQWRQREPVIVNHMKTVRAKLEQTRGNFDYSVQRAVAAAIVITVLTTLCFKQFGNSLIIRFVTNFKKYVRKYPFRKGISFISFFQIELDENSRNLTEVSGSWIFFFETTPWIEKRFVFFVVFFPCSFFATSRCNQRKFGQFAAFVSA